MRMLDLGEPLLDVLAIDREGLPVSGKSAVRSSRAGRLTRVQEPSGMLQQQGSSLDCDWLGTYSERLRLAHVEGQELAVSLGSTLLVNARRNWLRD